MPLKYMSKAVLSFCFASMVFLRVINTNAQQVAFVKTYLNSGINFSSSFVETGDSGFIIVGSSKISASLPQYSFAMRLNKYGDTLWTRNYFPDVGSILGVSSIDDSTF